MSTYYYYFQYFILQLFDGSLSPLTLTLLSLFNICVPTALCVYYFSNSLNHLKLLFKKTKKFSSFLFRLLKKLSKNVLNSIKTRRNVKYIPHIVTRPLYSLLAKCIVSSPRHYIDQSAAPGNYQTHAPAKPLVPNKIQVFFFANFVH